MSRRENEESAGARTTRLCAVVGCSMALILWCSVVCLLTSDTVNKNLGMVLCDLTIAVFIACLYEVSRSRGRVRHGKRLSVSTCSIMIEADSLSRHRLRTYAIWRMALGYGIPFLRFVRLDRLRHEVARGVALPWDGEETDWVIEWRRSR